MKTLFVPVLLGNVATSRRLLQPSYGVKNDGVVGRQFLENDTQTGLGAGRFPQADRQTEHTGRRARRAETGRGRSQGQRVLTQFSSSSAFRLIEVS